MQIRGISWVRGELNVVGAVADKAKGSPTTGTTSGSESTSGTEFTSATESTSGTEFTSATDSDLGTEPTSPIGPTSGEPTYPNEPKSPQGL